MHESMGMLVVRVAKLHRSVVAGELAKVGLHVGQDVLLAELDGSRGLSQRELADRLKVEQATVGVALRRLESAGFVRRQVSAEDARVRHAVLTEQGVGVLDAIRKAWHDAEHVLTSRLSDRRADELRRSLSALLDTP